MPRNPPKPKPIVTTRKITKKERKSVISDFHVLLKQKETLNRDKSINPEEKKTKLEQIERKISQMGGLQRYQNASLYGVAERKFDTSKWCIQQLIDSGKYKSSSSSSPSSAPTNSSSGSTSSGCTSSGSKLRVLDCGSITDSYRKHSHAFNVTAIDLNPRLPTVQQADFFTMPCEDRHYDVVVLSLILNFVTDPCKRADMLMKCQRVLVDKGALFIVLPRPCVDHSRYLTHEHLVHRIMALTLGFSLASHHMSSKLAFYHFTLTRRPAHFPYVPRTLLNDGDDRNNFSIIIRLEPARDVSRQEPDHDVISPDQDRHHHASDSKNSKISNDSRNSKPSKKRKFSSSASKQKKIKV